MQDTIQKRKIPAWFCLNIASRRAPENFLYEFFVQPATMGPRHNHLLNWWWIVEPGSIFSLQPHRHLPECRWDCRGRRQRGYRTQVRQLRGHSFRQHAQGRGWSHLRLGEIVYRRYLGQNNIFKFHESLLNYFWIWAERIWICRNSNGSFSVFLNFFKWNKNAFQTFAKRNSKNIWRLILFHAVLIPWHAMRPLGGSFVYI